METRVLHPPGWRTGRAWRHEEAGLGATEWPAVGATDPYVAEMVRYLGQRPQGWWPW